jgi:ribonuclease HI
MLIEIYCDGSSEGNSTGKGGWAYVLVVDGVKATEGSGHLAKATNNIAEITAAISGLKAASSYIRNCSTPNDDGLGVTLISDSQLVLRYATGEYQCKKWHLVPLYIELRKLYKEIGATTRWVKGHAGDPNNERCDELAKAAKGDPTPKPQD